MMLLGHRCPDVLPPDGREMSHEEITRHPELQRTPRLPSGHAEENPANEHAQKKRHPGGMDERRGGAHIFQQN